MILMQDHGGTTPIYPDTTFMLVSSTCMIVSRDSLRRGTGHQLSSLEHNQDQQEHARTNPCLSVHFFSLAMVFFLCSRLSLKHPEISPSVH